MDAKPFRFALIGLALLLLQGCGPSRPPMGKVSGIVTYNGKPVHNAQVSFVSDGAPRNAIARTDEEGRYELTTFERNDGAIVGTHKVVIRKPLEQITYTDDPSDENYKKALREAGKTKRTSELPERYVNAETTDLVAEVTKGSNSFDFELTD